MLALRWGGDEVVAVNGQGGFLGTFDDEPRVIDHCPVVAPGWPPLVRYGGTEGLLNPLMDLDTLRAR